MINWRSRENFLNFKNFMFYSKLFSTQPSMSRVPIGHQVSDYGCIITTKIFQELRSLELSGMLPTVTQGNANDLVFYELKYLINTCKVMPACTQETGYL